jgi:hypothetical protein
MAVLRRMMVLAAIAAVTMALAGCTRKITRVEVVQEPQSCFSCHSDANTILVDAEQQWEHSRHATGSTLNENDGTCKDCHTSEGFIARAEGTTPPPVIENPTAIHCFTCHAPHTNGDFRLRWTARATLMNGASADLGAGNICVACHQARRSVTAYVTGRPSLTNRWGPHHGVQGDMLLGSNGYEYPGYTYGQTAHKTATEDGCLDCHLKATSQYVVGGHSFNMRADLEGTEVLNVGACEPCHGAINDFNEVGPGYSVQDSVDALVTKLQGKLVTAGLVDGTTGLPKSVATSADSAGAVWNYLMVHEDRSRGIHNPQYILSLLNSAILYIDGSLAPQVTLRRAHD